MNSGSAYLPLNPIVACQCTAWGVGLKTKATREHFSKTSNIAGLPPTLSPMVETVEA